FECCRPGATSFLEWRADERLPNVMRLLEKNNPAKAAACGQSDEVVARSAALRGLQRISEQVRDDARSFETEMRVADEVVGHPPGFGFASQRRIGIDEV